MRQPIFNYSSYRLPSRNSRDLIEILDSTDQNCMKNPLLILMAALISIFLKSNTIIASEKTKQNNQHDKESTSIPHTSKKSEILQKNQLWLESCRGINFVPIPGGMFSYISEHIMFRVA